MGMKRGYKASRELQRHWNEERSGREGYREMWESREAIKFPGNYKDVGRKRDREGGM